MPHNSQPNTEADKMLDVYIHDYLVKRKLDASSKAFQDEAKLSTNVTAIDAPLSFLYEWWAVFWDVFIARYNTQGPGTDESSSETQTIRAQQQQQQHQRGEYQHQSGNANDVFVEQNPRTDTLSASRMYKEMVALLKHLSNDSAVQQRFGNNVRQPWDPPRSINIPPIKHQKQVSLPTRDIKSLMSSLTNPSAAGSDGSLIGVHGSGRALNNMPLRGWPLTGLDQIRPGLLQQRQSLTQSPQLQLQQHLLLQALQNSTSASATDLNSRELGFFLNYQNMGFAKADQLNSVNRIFPNDGLNVPVGLPVMLAKQQLENCNQHHQQYSYQPALLSHESQHPTYTLHRQDELVCASSIAANTSLLNTSQGNDQASNNRTRQKRKQPMSLLRLANSSRTAKVAELSQSSAPSTPSAHTTGDISSMPSLPHADGYSKHIYMVGDTGPGTPKPVADHSMHANYEDDVSLDDQNESLLSRAGPDHDMDAVKGFTFLEIGSIHASSVDCCHFSSDRNLLATGGQDKKARLWWTDSLEHNATLDEHSQAITDIRFSPNMPRLATTSLDKTVRIWDVENPGYSLQTFTGHPDSVMSLDFHPNKEDLVCSCDVSSKICYWSIKNGLCARVVKVGANQVRFQPIIGKYLGAVVGSAVSIIDSETSRTCRHLLKGHTSNVQSICWDISGEHLASISEDLVRVWKVGSGEGKNCIYELSVDGKRFRCAVFHPCCPSLLIIGCYQSLELWNMAENKMMTPLEQPISTLAVSEYSSLIASAGNDNLVKLWK